MTTAHTIDHTKGQTISTVSRQWAGRPDDQRFTSLNELYAQVNGWASASFEQEVAPKRFRAHDVGGELKISMGDHMVDPTNYAFSEVARMASAPAPFLRTLPASIAADCLNHGFKSNDADLMRGAYLMGAKNADDSPANVLRALTSTKYGRILDRDVVKAVQELAGNGTGDTRWKVPGTIDWGGSHGITYNPNVDITKDNTTLYASDRDVFLFLVDDMNPIEVGKLKNGDPDLMFRGFYVWNSEVGARTFGVATMYLRGVCQNRNLWGVEGFNEVSFRHTAGAPGKFITEAAPTLKSYADTGTGKLVAGVKAAKAEVVSIDDDERVAFLMKFGFSKRKANDLILTAICEEGSPPESVWDHAQAITAAARNTTYQDERLKMEAVAGDMLNRVKVDA